MNAIDTCLAELCAKTVHSTCELDGEDPDNVHVLATREDGRTVSGFGRTFEEAIRDALESYRLRQFENESVQPGQRLYEATIIERILDARKPHRRTTKRFIAASDHEAATLAAHAFRDRPGFLSGTAKFIRTIESTSLQFEMIQT